MTPSPAQVLIALALVGVVVFLLRLSRRRPAALQANVVILLAIGAWYLWWRATQTLVTTSPWTSAISLGLFAAECYGYLTLFFFYFQTWSPLYRTETPSTEGMTLPAVDIFVTILDEPLEVLYRTLVGCRAIRYPEDRKRVYVLDDGHRPEVREMAERLGCLYVSRPTNEHAKAGNLNYALGRTAGELIVNFDTDHVPVNTFLERTIGYFRDPNVALVQTAHHFYNPDPYQDNLRLAGQIMHEQELFFQVIQPGRDRANAAFFCGSGGIFRRSALDAVGGFLTTSTTEDIHTSIRLHAQGFRSVYVNDRLAAGLSPESFGDYLKQRDRWAQGHAQILFTRENPLWLPGLSLAQRINYLASISYFFLGLPRILYLAAPLFFLLFGTPPLSANIWMLAVHFLPYYAASLIVFHAVSGGQRNPFWSDVYEAAVCFAVTAATARAIIFPRLTKFYVTPKGVKRLRIAMGRGILPQLTLSAALAGGILWGSAEFLSRPHNPHASIISLVWATYNLLLLTAAIVVARQRAQLRGAPRLIRQLPCRLEFDGQFWEGVTLDLSERGASLTMDRLLRLPPTVTLTIYGAAGEKASLAARVVRNDRGESGQVFIGLEYRALTEEQHQSIVRLMYSDPEVWHAPPAPAAGFWPSLMLLLSCGLRVFIHETVVRRLSPRVRIQRRCDLVLQGQRFKGVTEDIGLNGVSVRLKDPAPAPLKPGPVTCLLYPGNGGELICTGEIMWVHADRTKPLVGILLIDYDRKALERLIQT
ncbi:MAG: PilZ domain-containing protein [Nitrospirota bacterium]